MLVLFWAVDARAERVLILRVKQSLIIRQVQGRVYTLQGAIAQIAAPNDRFSQVGKGIQTLDGTSLLRLDTQAGDLVLSPHSILRITKIQPDPQGGKLVHLRLEQGNVQLQLLPLPPVPPSRPSQSPRNLSGVRATLPACGFYITALPWLTGHDWL